MPTVDFTLDELLNELEPRVRGIVREELAEERVYTRALITEAVDGAKIELKDELRHVRRILSEDILAESGRLDKTIRRLDRHIADTQAHARPAA